MSFSKEHADGACNFIEGFLKHTGDYYGKPFILAPWEEEAVSELFGNIDDFGDRLIEMAYLEVVKKSGKTELAAAILLTILILAENPGCQAYGAASATRQALNVYRAACSMVEQNKVLDRNLRILRGTNRIVKTRDVDSFYAAVAADGDFGDGVNPSCTVADEVHRWKTRKQMENWDVLSKGGITRRQTLTIAITTAGVQSDSPLAWMLHEKTRKIRDGVIPPDPKFFGRIYAADPSDDPGSPVTWIKANPSLIENGGFLDKEKIANEYRKAIGEGDLTSFKRYFLNIWDQKESRAIDVHKWDLGAGDWKAMGTLPKRDPAMLKGELVEDKVRPLPNELLARFMGRRCWAGVDLSMTTDFTAVAFVFECEPKDDEEGKHREEYDVLPFFWLPDAKLKKLEYKLGVPLTKWGRDGFLEISEGDTIDYTDVQERLEWGAQMFDLRAICWDPANTRQLSVGMVKKGFTCIEVRQGYYSLSEPTKKVLELVANNNLHHGGHPVLRFNAGCACTVTDPKSNIMFAKPDLQTSSSRIDGMAAIVDALHYAITDIRPKSVYLKRGLRFL